MSRSYQIYQMFITQPFHILTIHVSAASVSYDDENSLKCTSEGAVNLPVRDFILYVERHIHLWLFVIFKLAKKCKIHRKA